jgi:protocatechuate 3,4-dioxygenase beta subunit
MQQQHPPGRYTRRAIAAAFIALPTIWIGPRAQGKAQRQLTPRQSEGPFYPVQLPADSNFDLLRNGALAYGRGQPVWIDGTVSNPQGEPLAGAQVEIWQCDADGHYDHPGDGARADKAFQGFGRVVVGSDGRYRFRSIRPAAYSGRTPHIHVKVRLGQRELLTTQLYVQDDPGNSRDVLWRNLRPADRDALTMPFRSAADGLSATFPIVVAA